MSISNEGQSWIALIFFFFFAGISEMAIFGNRMWCIEPFQLEDLVARLRIFLAQQAECDAKQELTLYFVQCALAQLAAAVSV